MLPQVLPFQKRGRSAAPPTQPPSAGVLTSVMDED